MTVSTPAVGDYRWHRRSWRRWSGRRWAKATYSAFPKRLELPREWVTYPVLPVPKRERLLETAVELEILAGATVVHRGDTGVTVSYPRRVTHVGHAILTRGEDRVRYEIDPWGNIWPVAAP